ncbi:RICIN domain-containing protein [Actinoplanes sp. NPDC049599]|uniref:RICIN domain-containing protein n=1 Tax=Actinoplanes sp. NPDC049599 TaxID=3363903 RepID=UPI00378BE3B4
MIVARLIAALAVAGVLATAAPAAAAPPDPHPDRQAGARAAALAGGPVIRSLDPDAAGKCLDAYNWGIGPWAQMSTCHGGANQQWTLFRYGDGTYDLFYAYQGTVKCLDGVAGRGQQATVWPCDGTLGQRFRKRGTTELEMVLENVRYPGQCLDVSNWGRDAAVILWDCHLGANQVWSRTTL